MCAGNYYCSGLLNKLLKSSKKSILMKDICEYRMRQYTHTCMLCQKANSRNNYWGSCVVRENVAISALLAWKPRKLEDMVMIDQRPPEVLERTIPGHWEGDLLLGKNRQSAMGSLVERKTRFAILVPLKSKHADVVRKAFTKEMATLPKQLRLTLTYD